MPVTYEAQIGERLEDIAQRFETTTEEILRVNELPDRERIRVRTVIRIPVIRIPPTVPSRRPFRNFNTAIIRNTLYVLSTDRMLYQRGQSVQMQLVKTNISNRPITLTYNTAQRYDFFIRRGTSGQVVWQWSRGRFFGQAVQRVTLAPGQSQVFTSTWDQRSNQGSRVQPGLYTVQAENMARELRNRRISARIRIV